MQLANKMKKYIKVGYSYFRNRQLTERSIRENKMYAGPWTAYLILTTKCNCKCVQCARDVEEANREKQEE